MFVLAVMIVATTIVGALVARKFGANKRARQAIFGLIAFVGFGLAIGITLARMRKIH